MYPPIRLIQHPKPEDTMINVGAPPTPPKGLLATLIDNLKTNLREGHTGQRAKAKIRGRKAAKMAKLSRRLNRH